MTTTSTSPEYQAYLDAEVEADGMTRDEYRAMIRRLNATADRHVHTPEVAIEAPPANRYGGNPGKGASKRTNRYGGKCHLCGTWIEAEAGLLTKVDGNWAVKHDGPCPEVAPAPVATPAPEVATPALDLSDLPAGTYAYEPETGQAQFIVVDKPETGKWAGWTFVKRQHGPNVEPAGKARPGGTYYGGNAANALTAIMADPRSAMALYGHLLGHCGACGLELTNEDSRERGIGPVCARKLGWL